MSIPSILPSILMVSTGGTITMTPAAAGQSGAAGIVPTLTAADLVAAVPALAGVARVEATSFLQVPSASLTLDDLIGLAGFVESKLAQGFDGAVVIQGTDTIEETAFVLGTLIDTDKPIVVTGAMRGPASPGAEGPANLLASAIVAAAPEARGLGVVAVLNDQIHAGLMVQKAHTALPSAFASPGSGPIGLVAEGRVRLLMRPTLTGVRLALPGGTVDQPVALVRLGLGDDARLLAALPGLGFAGAVIEGMGAGHVPALAGETVSRLIEAMPVVLASRVVAGPVFAETYGFPGSEIDLLRRGVICAGMLSGLKARLLLMLLLRQGADRAAIAQAFGRFR